MKNTNDKRKFTKEVREFTENLSHNRPQQDICETRTLYCINWYSKKADFYKVLYHVLSIINITVPLLSSIIIAFFRHQDFLVAIFSAIASFCASLLSLCGVKDRWTNYRSTTEFLKTQYTLYLAQATPYDTPERHTLYLNTIEAQMQNEHSKWVQAQKDPNAIDNEENGVPILIEPIK